MGPRQARENGRKVSQENRPGLLFWEARKRPLLRAVLISQLIGEELKFCRHLKYILYFQTVHQLSPGRRRAVTGGGEASNMKNPKEAIEKTTYSADGGNKEKAKAGAKKPKIEKKETREIGGREGPDPTRYGDWEKKGRCIDF